MSIDDSDTLLGQLLLVHLAALERGVRAMLCNRVAIAQVRRESVSANEER